MEEVACIRRGPKFGKVKAVFVNREAVGDADLGSLFVDGFVLLPSYTGRVLMSLSMGGIPSEFSTYMILACIFK